MPQPQQTFLLIKTQDPSEEAFVTYHDQEVLAKLGPNAKGNNGWPIPETTIYQNWFLKEGGRAQAGYGNYIMFSMDAAGGIVSFVWLKNKTEEEKKAPIKRWTDQGDHYWHGILHKVTFFFDYKFPMSTNGPNGEVVLAPRMYERIVYSPPVSEGSMFEHRLYQSPVPFKIAPAPVPMPDAVSWSYHGSQGSFPECLHPKLVFPAVQSAFAAYSTGGGEVSVSGSANGQLFPETNFTERAPYTLSNKQKETETGWVRHEIIVSPPTEEPEPAQR